MRLNSQSVDENSMSDRSRSRPSIYTDVLYSWYSDLKRGMVRAQSTSLHYSGVLSKMYHCPHLFQVTLMFRC